MVDFAAAALGEENRALVQRVWDRHFKIMGPCDVPRALGWRSPDPDRPLRPFGGPRGDGAGRRGDRGDRPPRSQNSHRHQFAEINEAWRHLPESLQEAPLGRQPGNPSQARPHRHGLRGHLQHRLWGQGHGRACPYGAGISGGREARLRDSQRCAGHWSWSGRRRASPCAPWAASGFRRASRPS